MIPHLSSNDGEEWPILRVLHDAELSKLPPAVASILAKGGTSIIVTAKLAQVLDPLSDDERRRIWHLIDRCLGTNFYPSDEE